MDLSRTVELARRLRAARALSGKDVRDLAREVGLSPRAYYRLEAGDRVPSAIELEDIAAATGVAIGFFFGASSPNAAEAGTVTPSPAAVKASAPSQRKRSRELRRRLNEGSPA